jgi:hypothetical protein
MEEDLLREMIRDRETQIKMIERKMEEQTKKMERTKTTISEIREDLQKASVAQQLEIEEMEQALAKIKKKYEDAIEALDMKKQQTALHMYQDVMKSVGNPEDGDSSYVLRMQAQLCKAMHSMGMAENQFSLVNKQTAAIQKTLKEEITSTTEEKSSMELKLMNDLMVADGERRDLEQKHKAMMDKFYQEKEVIEKLLEEQAEREEDEEEEVDDEEREELLEILTQGREEVQSMVDGVEAKKKEIEELREKLAALQGISVDEVEIGIIDYDAPVENEEDEDEEDQ